MLRRQVQDVEGKLPEKVTITLKCPMTGYQGAIYDWVRAKSLLRINPESPDALRRGTNIISVRNRVMEQRKVCAAPLSSCPASVGVLQSRCQCVVVCACFSTWRSGALHGPGAWLQSAH